MKWVQEKVCQCECVVCNSGNLRLGQGEGRGAGDREYSSPSITEGAFICVCDEESAAGTDYGS